jgi:hypothetical protein
MSVIDNYFIIKIIAVEDEEHLVLAPLEQSVSSTVDAQSPPRAIHPFPAVLSAINFNHHLPQQQQSHPQQQISPLGLMPPSQSSSSLPSVSPLLSPEHQLAFAAAAAAAVPRPSVSYH